MRINKKTWKLSEKIKDAITREYLTGAILQELSCKYNIAISSVAAILKHRGVKRPYRRKGSNSWKLNNEQKTQITMDYKGGETSPMLSRRHAVSESFILQLLKKSGVPRRRPGPDRIYDLRADAFDTLTEESKYWLGFLIADGYVNDTQLILALSRRDEHHVKKFRDFLGSTHPIKEKRFKIRGQIGYNATITISSIELVRKLGTYGIIRKKSMIAQAPAVLKADCHFWRGVIDGDGWIGISKERWPRAKLELVGSESLMMQFAEFVKIFVSDRIITVRPHKSIFRVGLSGRAARIVIKLLYDHCTVALSRKLTTAHKIMQLTMPRYKKS